MPRAALTLALICAFAMPLAAQAPKSIDPGMSQAQVIERLGEPAASRTSGNFTYLFYKNGCVKVCGMDDIVLLENDAVVDAIFRAHDRAYTGRSSSPHAIPADVAARRGARDVPTGEVTQAGSPRPEPVEATDPAEPPAKAAAPEPVRRDSSGTLRIKVKPQHGTAGAANDSTKGASRKPTPR